MKPPKTTHPEFPLHDGNDKKHECLHWQIACQHIHFRNYRDDIIKPKRHGCDEVR